MKFSFIIPAYNALSTIEKCLKSVISQTYQNWEAIVVDDGSKDDTYSRAFEFSKMDKRIRVYKKENEGPGLTRNFAIKQVVGDYIVFLDSDDYIDNDYLQSVSDCIEEKNADVVILDNYYETAAGKLIRIEKLSQFSSLSQRQLIGVQMTGKMPWGGCRKVIKHTIIKDNMIEYTEDKVGEEALFSFKVFLFASNIVFLGKPVYHYVDYPQSQSKKGADDPWGGVVDKISNYIRLNLDGETFEKEVNSFAYTALVVSLYRISSNYSLGEAIKLCKLRIRETKEKYPMNVDSSCLEKRVRIMLWFARLGWVLPIVLASKLKNLIKGK